MLPFLQALHFMFRSTSDSEFSRRLDGVDTDLLQSEHVKIVTGGHPLEVALSHAVLLSRGETRRAPLDVVHAVVEALGDRAHLESRVEAALVLVEVLLFVLVEERVLQIEQLGPGAEEFVAIVVLGRVGHGVLAVTHVSADLLSVVLTAIQFSPCVHFIYLLIIIINYASINLSMS